MALLTGRVHFPKHWLQIYITNRIYFLLLTVTPGFTGRYTRQLNVPMRYKTKAPSHIQDSRHNGANNSGHSSVMTQFFVVSRDKSLWSLVIMGPSRTRRLFNPSHHCHDGHRSVLTLSWRREAIIKKNPLRQRHSRLSYDCHNCDTTIW